MRLETDMAAWVLDETCMIVGRKVEHLLSEKKNPFESATKQYASATASGKTKRMKVPENGVW